MAEIHATTIIADRLEISYEPAEVGYIDEFDGNGQQETEPEAAVLLLTRCCKINHDHISLDKAQALKLGVWLFKFAAGEYDE